MALKTELRRVEVGLPFLATVGSAAPFIGLFGTVWGIVNSFTAIAQQKDTSLAVVAPGIAEALIATALGLAAAIPAVMAYNQISVSLGRAYARGNTSIVELAKRLARPQAEPVLRTASSRAAPGRSAPLMAMSVGNGGYESGDEGGYRPMAEINITPMVDVMLVLLIIFMVTAPLLIAGVPCRIAEHVRRPHQPAEEAGDRFTRRRRLALYSGRAGHPRYSGAEAHGAPFDRGDMVVYVRADKSRAYGEVMEVLGRVGESGYPRVSLLSQPKASGGSASQGQ